MPTINSKYRTDREIMENPTQQDERDYQSMLIANEVERISDKYKGTPNFRKLVALELAKRELELDKERERSAKPSVLTGPKESRNVLGFDSSHYEGLFQ